VARQVQEKLLEGVVLEGSGTDQKMSVPAINADKSEQLLIELMTGLSSAEIDEIPFDEYNNLKIQIEKITKGEKK
jgi:hypothetical protein